MSQAASISHDSRIVRILVADADNDTRALYRDMLQLAGCDVIVAANGRDALVSALSHRPTAVITDTRLPIFDGYALCEVLRRDTVTRGVPILVVTSETRQTELDRAHEAGADAVLTKPASPEALLAEIRRLLQHPDSAKKPLTAHQAVPRGGSNARGSKPLVKAYHRFSTRTPTVPPPELRCPECAGSLSYESSYVGGVSAHHPERWDDFECPTGCGTFQYRQRTRKLRKVS